MTDTTLTVSFNFNALHQAFSSRIARILERATLALNAVDQASAHTGLVPNVPGPAMPIQLPPRPLAEVRPETVAWIVGCALRDSLEEASNLLEETRRMCAALALSGRERIPAEEFDEAVNGPREQFDRRTFPGKIEYLREHFGDVLDARIEHVESLVRARNCLVHRLGVVAERDCNDVGQLVVRWRSFDFFVRHTDGQETALVPPRVVGPGDQLLLKHSNVERRFSVGERIALTTGELCGVWMTLQFFGVGMARRVVEFAKSKGMVITETEQVAQAATQGLGEPSE